MADGDETGNFPGTTGSSRMKRTKPPNRKRPGPPRKGRLRDPKYLDWIRTQPCACCGYPGVEAAHVGNRGLGQKSSDHETIALCVYHHRDGPYSAHVAGKRFWELQCLDRDALIATYRARYLAENPERASDFVERRIESAGRNDQPDNRHEPGAENR